MENLWYSDRLKLIKLFEDWCEKENLDPNDKLNLIAWLNMYYLLNDENIKSLLKKDAYKEAESHFIKLGIPKEALDSEIIEDGNCNQLIYGKCYSYYGAKEEWYLDYNCSISTGWDSKTLLDILIAIETNSNKRIVKFGLCKNNEFSSYADKHNKVMFRKIPKSVCLDEDKDQFNLQLDDGRYFHLYFCESK